MSSIPYMSNPVNYGAYQSPMSQGIGNQQLNGMIQGGMMPQTGGMIQPVGVQNNGFNGQPMQPMQGRVDFGGAFITSYEEVKSWGVPQGGLVLLMDKNSNKFYIKALDNNGTPVISAFVFNDLVGNREVAQEEKPKTNNEIETLRVRVDQLENKITVYEGKFNTMASVRDVASNNVGSKK